MTMRGRAFLWVRPMRLPFAALVVVAAILLVVTPRQNWHYITAAAMVCLVLLIGIKSAMEDFFLRFGPVEDSFDEVRREHQRRLHAIDGPQGKLAQLDAGLDGHRHLLEHLNRRVETIETNSAIKHLMRGDLHGLARLRHTKDPDPGEE